MSGERSAFEAGGMSTCPIRVSLWLAGLARRTPDLSLMGLALRLVERNREKRARA